MATGANTAPLGKLHPILAGKYSKPTSHRSGSSAGSRDPELKKHLEEAKRAASAIFSSKPPTKKRKSRWGTDDARTILPGLPTVLPSTMKEDEQKLYLLHLKIEENSRMLRTGDLGIPINPADRSPSPEPIYSHDGKRLNTREVRVRKRLEDERHDLIQKATGLNAEYKPPADYKAPNRKFEDKVFIPQDHHPETNFVGLLIGPRGNTLKQLERETSTKIMIRGKGATKEGKLGRAGLPQPGEDEPLHALITGNTPEIVKNAVDKIKSIIQSGIDVPGNDNDLKKLQLQQLAELNGTFKPLEILKCRNCGSSQHKTWECHEHENIIATIVCTRCGGGGHIASDCKADLSSVGPPADKAKMDSEYLSLMKELGESVPESHTSGTAVPPPSNLTGPKPNSRAARPGGVPPWMQPQQGAPLMPGPPLQYMMVPHAVPTPWGVPTAVPLMTHPMSVPGMHPGHTGYNMPSSESGGAATSQAPRYPQAAASAMPLLQTQPAPGVAPPLLPQPLVGTPSSSGILPNPAPPLLPHPPGYPNAQTGQSEPPKAPHPWQQAQGQVPPWQQPTPLMYTPPPPPPPAGMGGRAAPPPLPPGAPPPPPPDQNSWSAGAPPPPPPPPSES